MTHSTMTADKEWYIYHLIDPRYYSVRYVGWTTDMKKRLIQHTRSVQKGEKSLKADWFREVLAEGFTPIIVQVGLGFGLGWEQAEIAEIALQRSLGAKLTNGTDGGDGVKGYKFSKEQTDKRGKK